MRKLILAVVVGAFSFNAAAQMVDVAYMFRIAQQDTTKQKTTDACAYARAEEWRLMEGAVLQCQSARDIGFCLWCVVKKRLGKIDPTSNCFDD